MVSELYENLHRTEECEESNGRGWNFLVLSHSDVCCLNHKFSENEAIEASFPRMKLSGFTPSRGI